MKKVYLIVFILFVSFGVRAQDVDYTLLKSVELYHDGNKQAPIIWSDASIFTWSPSAPSTSSPGSSGTITIPSGVTLELSATFYFNGTIIVKSGGTLMFNRDPSKSGQLIMDASSTIVLEKDATITSTGSTGDAGDNQNYLEIGGNGIYGGDINLLPAPPYNLDGDYMACRNDPNNTSDYCNSLLPINLLYFNSTAQATAVELNWAASKAWDFSHYELERSRNGQSFSHLATIDAEKNTDFLTEFSYTDPQPFAGISYYRLKAVDIDGKFEYKGIVVVQFDGNSYELYPNPVTNGSLNISSVKVSEGARLILRDHTGRTVRSLLMNGREERISTENLPAGLYILLVQSSEQTFQSQVFIR